MTSMDPNREYDRLEKLKVIMEERAKSTNIGTEVRAAAATAYAHLVEAQIRLQTLQSFENPPFPTIPGMNTSLPHAALG